MRGYRIELGEIEATLKQHAQVRDAVVVARSNGNGAQGVRGETRLIAYVVGEGERKQQSKQLREFLTERLSEQMIPSAFVFLDAIPVTPNGKVDRRALPPPDFSISDTAQETDDVPRTESERILVRIWSELLKLERVGRHDNFFHLGGDSILSIQVVARARQSDLLLTPRQIFEHPTIATLAAVGEAISQGTDEQGRITVVHRGDEVVDQVAAVDGRDDRFVGGEGRCLGPRHSGSFRSGPERQVNRTGYGLS